MIEFLSQILPWNLKWGEKRESQEVAWVCPGPYNDQGGKWGRTCSPNREHHHVRSGFWRSRSKSTCISGTWFLVWTSVMTMHDAWGCLLTNSKPDQPVHPSLNHFHDLGRGKAEMMTIKFHLAIYILFEYADKTYVQISLIRV